MRISHELRHVARRRPRAGKLSIPEDWAISPNGEPTVSPAMALAGAMLPIAGHKGIGIAMMVQALAASLSGAAHSDLESAREASSVGGAGAFVLLINPALLTGQEAFAIHTQHWLSTYLSSRAHQRAIPGNGKRKWSHCVATSASRLTSRMLLELSSLGVRYQEPLDTRHLVCPQSEH